MWDIDVGSALDLSGAFEQIDTDDTEQKFMTGDLRDDVGYLNWALDLAVTDPIHDQIKTMRNLADFKPLSDPSKVTQVTLEVHLVTLLKLWKAVDGNDDTKLQNFRALFLRTLLDDPTTAKVVLMRQRVVDHLHDADAQPP